MDYFKALEVFEIDNGANINAEFIKKQYRKLSKKWHPDVCKDDKMFKEVGEAYKELINYLKASEKDRVVTGSTYVSYTISLLDLINIFKGKPVKVDAKTVINKDTIAIYKIYVKLDVNVVVGGITMQYSSIQPRNIKDIYSMDIVISDTDINKPLDITVGVLDKKIDRTMEVVNMNFRFNLDYISQINIGIQRVPIDS